MARTSVSPIFYANENKMKREQEFAGKNIKILSYCTFLNPQNLLLLDKLDMSYNLTVRFS
jgi:hypothetical protein